MYYEIYGTGILPLVLIHGGGSTIETSFGASLPLFAAYGKVIAVELQAHGRTGDRNTPESFDQDADDVAALMQYLKVDKANFLGFSNGGTTALKIAIKHPEIVNKTVALSAVYRRDGLIPGFFDGMQHATLKDMPAPLQEGYLKVAPDKSQLQVMFDKDVQRMVAFKDWPDSELRSIKAHTLIMAADKDVTTPEHAIKMTQLIPGARLCILPGVHGSCIGEACTPNKDDKLIGAIVTLIEAFLKE